MDKVRFVFKSHLLPPIVMPFDNMNTYMLKVYPRQYEQLKHVTSIERKQRVEAKRAEMMSMNQVLLKQVLIFKQKYIFPLKKSPSYYEQLDKTVCMNLLKKSSKEDYLKQIKTISIAARLKCHQKFQTNYKRFKSKLGKNEQNILNEVPLIPIFIYNSPEELAEKDHKKWTEISQSERNDYELIFIKLVQEYNQEIQKVLTTADMAKKQLLKTMTQFLQYSQASNIKLLLLS